MLSTGLLPILRFTRSDFQQKPLMAETQESMPFELKWFAVAVALCIRSEYVHPE
jgi:hypothetical protein